jgi:hypothetical protein
MEYREMDQHLGELTGREAVIQKVEYILGIRKGELPYFQGGIQIQEFTRGNSGEILDYIVSELKKENLDCDVQYTDGYFVFVDLKVQYKL